MSLIVGQAGKYLAKYIRVIPKIPKLNCFWNKTKPMTGKLHKSGQYCSPNWPTEHFNFRFFDYFPVKCSMYPIFQDLLA